MIEIGKKIVLIGKTLKGKNQIDKNGSVWQVVSVTDRVLFSPNKPGPWIYVIPVGAAHDHEAGKWVHKTDDINFQISSNTP